MKKSGRGCGALDSVSPTEGSAAPQVRLVATTLERGPSVVRSSSFSRDDKSRLLLEIFQLLRPEDQIKCLQAGFSPEAARFLPTVLEVPALAVGSKLSVISLLTLRSLMFSYLRHDLKLTFHPALV